MAISPKKNRYALKGRATTTQKKKNDAKFSRKIF